MRIYAWWGNYYWKPCSVCGFMMCWRDAGRQGLPVENKPGTFDAVCKDSLCQAVARLASILAGWPVISH